MENIEVSRERQATFHVGEGKNEELTMFLPHMSDVIFIQSCEPIQNEIIDWKICQKGKLMTTCYYYY